LVEFEVGGDEALGLGFVDVFEFYGELLPALPIGK
jgi:hypothetical protein